MSLSTTAGSDPVQRLYAVTARPSTARRTLLRNRIYSTDAGARGVGTIKATCRERRRHRCDRRQADPLRRDRGRDRDARRDARAGAAAARRARRRAWRGRSPTQPAPVTAAGTATRSTSRHAAGEHHHARLTDCGGTLRAGSRSSRRTGGAPTSRFRRRLGDPDARSCRSTLGDMGTMQASRDRRHACGTGHRRDVTPPAGCLQFADGARGRDEAYPAPSRPPA